MADDLTMVEGIIQRHALDKMEVGGICRARVDFAFGNDITSPPAIIEFTRMGATRVFDKERCAVLADHFTPNKDIASANQVREGRIFAKAHGIHFWDAGRCGVEHAFLPEQGLILPGDIIVGRGFQF